MTLDEWIAATPGMAQLESDIKTHITSCMDVALDFSEVDDAVRCIMISVRQAWENKK